MTTITKETVMETLRRNGFKVTPQRLAICEFMLARKDHPNAERVLVELQKQHPAISRATIYNTLHVLQQLGLIQELRFDNGITRYDPDTTVHVNLVCRDCGQIVDFKNAPLTRAWRDMVLTSGVNAVGQRLDLYHVCESCQTKVNSQERQRKQDREGNE